MDADNPMNPQQRDAADTHQAKAIQQPAMQPNQEQNQAAPTNA